MNKEPIRCRDACGRVVADEAEATAKAWQAMAFSIGCWRCPACADALRAVNNYTENDSGDSVQGF